MTLTIPLFLKPGWMLPEGEPVSADKLRELGKHLQAHLEQAATIIQKLAEDGWQCTMSLYDAFCNPPDALAREDVEKRLSQLGIALNEDAFLEDEDDETEMP